MGKVIRDPNKPLCGAKRTKRGGEPCKHLAGYGTDHPGQGACKYHGGCSAFPSGPANPNYKHGGFSRHLKEGERPFFDEFREACGLMQDTPSDEEELALFRLVTAVVTPDEEVSDGRRGELLELASRIRLNFQKLRGGEKPDEINVNLNARDELAARIAARIARRRAAGGTGESA